jgi:hypothetical protein
VTVDGSNVVNKSQQRFYTSPGEDWQITLLLYSMQIQAKDGLFGFPIGKSVNIEFPDGRIENYPFDQKGMVEIHSLARGTYYTEVVGANGLSNRIPVALSRDQEVATRIVTYLDITVVGSFSMVLALSLLFYGRPSLLSILRKRDEHAAPEKEWGYLPEAYAERWSDVCDYPHLIYEELKEMDAQTFQWVTGIDRLIFERILVHFEKMIKRKDNTITLSGADQILLTIVAHRENYKPFEMGKIYGVSANTVRRVVKRVDKLLIYLGLSEKNFVLKPTKIKNAVVLADSEEVFYEK